jgi:hypothetical protein
MPPPQYGRQTIQFGFSSGFPPDVVALLAIVFVTFSMQFFAATAALVDWLRLTPMVVRGTVWQLLTYPLAGIGEAGFFLVLGLVFLFFFARDVFARLGRARFWQLLAWSCGLGGVVAIAVDWVARWIGHVPEGSLSIIQGQYVLWAVISAAFAVLYRDATVLLLVLPVPAYWLLPLEVVFAFVAFLRTHDLPGFLGLCTAILVTWALLTRRGLLGAGREAKLRLQSWWLRRKMDRLRRKRGFHVVSDRKEPWLH